MQRRRSRARKKRATTDVAGKESYIWGFHAVASRLRQNAAAVKEIYLDPARVDRRAKDLAEIAEDRGVRVMSMEHARLDGMTGHASHQGVVARVEAPKQYQDLDSILDALTEPALLLVLDGVQDPHNLGACTGLPTRWVRMQ